MDLRFTPADEAFRAEVRAWLRDHLVGDYAALGGAGRPGREHEGLDVRMAWERELGAAGWIGLDWPRQHGGREATLLQQVIFHEEYAAAGAPGRVNHVGEQLLAPTVLAYGTDAQKRRFLPGILRGTELWCQGYSEPDAGSDLAAVRTQARLDGDVWRIDGQKVWTSLAEHADWTFAVVRSEPGSERHKGLSYLLVPMDQPGVEIRPIVQITGTSEFSEVFFSDAVTAAENIVGAPGDGWRVALGTLAFERGVATLGQQIGFARELEEIADSARASGAIDDPEIADRIATAFCELRVLRFNALRTLAGDPTAAAGAASVAKLLWAPWHQRLGELAIDVRGVETTLAASGDGYALDGDQALWLYTRSDTIYAGSNEIQRNIIAERMLGLPRG
ncbi:acyl-CoA dehydrogenase family protein [Conexibacter sp. JD483]|uniref:acyl-CoA dehydrogenase family protein n=1 Tax=unclassified Conexibacter TaxID=2627773 RepID=UPI002717DED6|nr:MULTISPECIES: acyl-CoA dehydrogenase family protein [unclassified Conexibacter]MDO8186830.1 acyl-CoA dehydrogenase family protein [Conexibacter sp. CPCC 205706]MDO8197416.1 acyl-CoA dehydrogenase family protein [Conexibacter sp. CPCC 205762]MDR9371232.1 acyl-CoA dehydrogenase family protein [Conexibacter sp. JD483]